MNNKAHQALLQRFEPVLRFTRGEQFFPMDAETYVQACSLWVQPPNQERVCLIPKGKLSLEKLAEPRADHFGTVYFLKFIEPLNVTEMAAYRLREGLSKKDPQDIFHPGYGRLARVGYTSRLVDAAISLSLLGRGRVSGDTSAAAIQAYKQMQTENEIYCYHGRVISENDWTVLQYWFLYAFNNWRSNFFGGNDHEADWEMISIYLYKNDAGEYQPEWVAYGSHDYSGDDLRRRWDDPELEKIGEHPIIYVSAGSHANYYTKGEYQAEFKLPFVAPLGNLINHQKSFWQKILKQPKHPKENKNKSPFNIFHIAFVDYARGDGLSIGPNQAKTWSTPRLLSPPPNWILNYRGLWGLYARDPASMEDAPAGPMHNRDGTIRQAWYAPLAWAGLDKIPPPNKTLIYVEAQQTNIKNKQIALEVSATEKSNQLMKLGIEAEAMQKQPHLKKVYQAHQTQIATLTQELNKIRSELATNEALLEALNQYSVSLKKGYRGDPRGHIRRAYEPASDIELRLSRFAEMWAAISIGLLMIGFVLITLFAPGYPVWDIIILIFLVAFIEASAMRRLTNLIRTITITLALISTSILLYEFFWEIFVIGVLLTGAYIMRENLRELF